MCVYIYVEFIYTHLNTYIHFRDDGESDAIANGTWNGN